MAKVKVSNAVGKGILINGSEFYVPQLPQDGAGDHDEEHLGGKEYRTTHHYKDGREMVVDAYVDRDNMSFKMLDVVLSKNGVELVSVHDINAPVNFMGAYTKSGGMWFKADHITGNRFADTIYADDGNDTLIGNGGSDFLSGEYGNDRLFGGWGRDEMNGDPGADYLNGGEGNDLLDGGLTSHADTLLGEAGNDEIYGGGGADRLFGGTGQDHLEGISGADLLFGHSGNDHLTGGSGKDRLNGGKGADTLIGGTGSDIMDAGSDAATDTFVFEDALDSDLQNVDKILNFGKNDLIDLSQIALETGNLTFSAEEALAFGIWTVSAPRIKGLHVMIDVTGDAVADMQISLIGRQRLDADDFLV